MRYEEMFPDEFVQKLRESPVAYVPFGLLEWHGKHLTLGLDGIKAHEICQRIAEKTGGVVLPTTYWGTEGLNMTGTLSVELLTIRNLSISIFRQLAKQGFQVIVALTGHYSREQVFTLKEAADYCQRMLNLKGERVRIVAMPEYELVTELGYEGDHAAKWETSIMMYLRPKLVDLRRLDELVGVFGDDPKTASSDLGRSIVDEIVSRTASLVEKHLRSLSAEEKT